MKKRRILSIALVLIMCLSLLSGCSKPDSSTSSGGDPSGDAGGESAGGGTIKVGLLAPLTGNVAEYGNAVSNGVKLYIKQLNEAGGINGKTIELVEYDEEGDATKAVTGYGSLVDQNVTAIIGDVTSGPTLAVVPEAFNDNMPMITASATADSVTYDSESDTVYTNMFRSCFIDPFQGEKMANFADENLGAKTAAVLYDTGDDYSSGLMESFVETCGELGIEVVSVEGYATGSVDFQSQLTNISSKNPDLLFVPVYYSDVALIAQQANSVGLDATMIGCDGWDTVLDIISDATLLEGAYYCSGYSVKDTSEAIQKFLGDYEAEYGSTPNMFAAQGYDAANILMAAIEVAEGKSLEAGSDDYKQAVIDAMSATDMNCVTGHITFDEYNNPQKTAAIINITGSEAEFWGNY